MDTNQFEGPGVDATYFPPVPMYSINVDISEWLIWLDARSLRGRKRTMARKGKAFSSSETYNAYRPKGRYAGVFGSHTTQFHPQDENRIRSFFESRFGRYGLNIGEIKCRCVHRGTTLGGSDDRDIFKITVTIT